VERPGGQPCSLVAGNRNPLADALELLQGDAALGALGDSNDSLGDRWLMWVACLASRRARFFSSRTVDRVRFS
jgi:hypothetical protein